MIITFGELWESVKNYPRSLNYYDKNKNEEDSITCEVGSMKGFDEMRDFASEHCKDLVDDFSIYTTRDGFRLEVSL